MLSLSDVPCCESGVMKTQLSCHKSARRSAAAATGSIGSIIDVSMQGTEEVGSRGREASEQKEGFQGSYTAVFSGVGLGAAPQATFVWGPRV